MSLVKRLVQTHSSGQKVSLHQKRPCICCLPFSVQLTSSLQTRMACVRGPRRVRYQSKYTGRVQKTAIYRKGSETQRASPFITERKPWRMQTVYGLNPKPYRDGGGLLVPLNMALGPRMSHMAPPIRRSGTIPLE